MACFSFILTEVCDWNCGYCQFPLLKKQNQLTTDKIIRNVPYIRDIVSKTAEIQPPYMEIQGGEVGLIGEHTLALFLEELDYPVNVSTNGLFLERGYHLNHRIRPYVKEVQWHLCDRPGDYKLNLDYNDNNIFINKGIVHDNVDEIAAFISRNPHIQFNYVELECDIQSKRSPHTEDYTRLYKEIKSMGNVSENALEILEGRAYSPEDKRDKCKNYHSVVSINMASETICLCQRATNVNIPLTRENLIKRLNTFPCKLFNYPDEIVGCDSCIRLFSGKYEFFPREILKLRRLDFNES